MSATSGIDVTILDVISSGEFSSGYFSDTDNYAGVLLVITISKSEL